MKRFFIPLLLLTGGLLWAGGESEAAGSDFTSAAAAEGGIVAPEEIEIASFISGVDYRYPDPTGEVGLFLYTAHDSLSLQGQKELLHIGLQGARGSFDDLSPLNLVFLFDASGSMSADGKIDLVRIAFESLAKKLRPGDVLSVVACTEEAAVLFPASAMSGHSEPAELADKMAGVLPCGTADYTGGITLAYEQLTAFSGPERVNRILFLSDGRDLPEEAFKLAARGKTEGYGLTGIGVGTDADIAAISRLAKEGGGSSRFMEDEAKARSLFGADFARMTVPAARDLRIEVVLENRAELVETWGYRHEASRGRAVYHVNALHRGDYETILARLDIPPGSMPGKRRIAAVSVAYTDLAGNLRRLPPIMVESEFSFIAPGAGKSGEVRVLKSSTQLAAAEGLRKIGEVYHSCAADQSAMEPFYRMSMEDNRSDTGTIADELTAAALQERSGSIRARKEWCFLTAAELKRHIGEARNTIEVRTGELMFENEIGVLHSYIETLGRELYYQPEIIRRYQSEK